MTTDNCAHEEAVKWNPYNGAVQCHRCGEVFAPINERVKVATAPDDDGDGMNSRRFVREWLEQRGMFDADADYGGMVGECVMEVVETIARQGHTGMSVMSLLGCIDGIYRDYNDPDSPQWKAYWASPAGKAFVASFMGEVLP